MSFLDEHAKAAGKARWIDKTPHHPHHLNFIGEVFATVRQRGRSRYGWARHWAEVYERVEAFQAAVGEKCS